MLNYRSNIKAILNVNFKVFPLIFKIPWVGSDSTKRGTRRYLDSIETSSGGCRLRRENAFLAFSRLKMCP